jgi:hypothetical protein
MGITISGVPVVTATPFTEPLPPLKIGRSETLSPAVISVLEAVKEVITGSGYVNSAQTS